MYTRTDIENLYVQIGCCAADKAYQMVQQYNAGTEVCDCEQANLSYLVNIREFLKCYTPVGEIIDEGAPSISTTVFNDDTGPYDAISILSSFSSLNVSLVGVYATVDDAIRALVTQINLGTWTAVSWVAPDGRIVFRLTSPDDDTYCGSTFTISIRLTGGSTFTTVTTGTLTGGQCLVAPADLCMTQSAMDTWLNNVIENFREICNGCCDDNNTDA